MPAARLDEHLAGCVGCRQWQDAAAEVTRRARLVPAPPVPDVAAAVLAALPAVARPRRRHRLDGGLRIALLVVGAGQLAVAVPTLTGSAPAGTATSVHLVHETAAWNLGLAACFLVVAALPRLAAGSLPFLLPFTAVLGWVTVQDLGAGHVHAGRAGVHLLLVAGVLLVSLLAVRGRAVRGGPAGTRAPWSAWQRATSRWTVPRRPVTPSSRATGTGSAARAVVPGEQAAA